MLLSINIKKGSIKSGQSIYDTANVLTKDDIRRDRLRPSKGVAEAFKTYDGSCKVLLPQDTKTGKRMKNKIELLQSKQTYSNNYLEPLAELRKSVSTNLNKQKREASQ